MEKDLPIPPGVLFIVHVVLTLVSLLVIVSIVREVVTRLRAGPVRFRLAMASQANGLRGLDALVMLAILVGPLSFLQIMGRKTGLEGTLPVIVMLWCSCG